MRPPEAGEAGAIAELLDQLGYPSTEEQVRARLEALASTPDHSVLVAELSLPTGERIVAGLLALEVGRLLHRDDRHAHLTALVTHRQFRHRGVARALLAAAEMIARREGCAFLHLRSSAMRDDAHGFFRAMGFEETHLAFDKKL